MKFKQHFDPLWMYLNESVLRKNNEYFSQGNDGVFRYQERLCVSYVDDLRERIIEEAHGSLYYIHQGATKMYYDLHEIYYGME